MTLPNEGNPVDAGGSGANPNSSTSSSQPLQGDYAEVIADLRKKIDAQQGEINALKSGKDKAVDRVVKAQEDTLARLAKYLNVDESQLQEAQRKSVLDDLIAERMGKPQPAQPIGGTVDRQGASMELRVIDQILELPENDARVTELKLKYSDPLEYGKAARALKSQLSTNPPTPAEMPLPQGKAPSADIAAQIEKGYLEEAAKVQRGNVFQLNEVKKKWRAKAREAGLQLNV